jgi:hypothetical protein
MLKLLLEFQHLPTEPLAVAILLGLVVQLVPFHNSVADLRGGDYPPNANAKVCVPAPPNSPLAVFILLTLVQEVPFQDSVAACICCCISAKS